MRGQDLSVGSVGQWEARGEDNGSHFFTLLVTLFTTVLHFFCFLFFFYLFFSFSFGVIFEDEKREKGNWVAQFGPYMRRVTSFLKNIRKILLFML